MKLWILCRTGRDISIRFVQSKWQRRVTPNATAGPPATVWWNSVISTLGLAPVTVCGKSATGGSRFHCTCYGFNGKVQQVEYQFVGPAPAPLTVRHWQMSRLIVLDRHDREPVAQGTAYASLEWFLHKIHSATSALVQSREWREYLPCNFHTKIWR